MYGEKMKPHAYLIILILVGALGSVASAQAASSTAFSQVVVSKATVDPTVLMYDDIGSITITITNTGTEAVPINRATLFLDGIVLLNPGAYDSVTTLGPGNSKEFTFRIQARGTGGLYQPMF